MKNQEITPIVKYRKDYLPSAYLIEKTNLVFELNHNETIVTTELNISANDLSDSSKAELKLNGEDLELLEISINGEPVAEQDYATDPESLTLNNLPGKGFILKTQVRIHPEKNTLLEGLYRSGKMFCTQCEAQGFRHITYYLDRPDVLSVFSTRIIADKKEYPQLLSNGNSVERGELENNRHFVEWHDPFPKPCYLFALVAGDLDLLEDKFITASGREVALEIYVDKGKLNQCHHAMESLKKSMLWDEQTFGLEYDLDIYMIVAVGDFNMGAMENKGLNVFNTKYVLADVATATDDDFLGVESVIGHEYFHNWTGNRITCRDWFQLSLKEGLTVFRDQEFSSDLNSRSVKRIKDVQVIRSAQFAEDSGPMSHPIRPDSYIEMNNFYTVTVYNKGAEVIRMMHTLLGVDGFRKGMDLYFERHDGQAVTCEDYICALESANNRDLKQFRNWYSQSGTPEVVVEEEHWDESTKSFNLTLSQSCPVTKEQPEKQPFLIPVKLTLMAETGEELSVCYEGNKNTEFVVELTQEKQQFVFTGVDCPVKLSLLRDFSAPVKLERHLSDEDLTFFMAHDSNAFSCWDAGQQLMNRVIWQQYDALVKGDSIEIPSSFVDAVKHLLFSEKDPAFIALALALPSIGTLEADREQMDVGVLQQARIRIRKHLSKQLNGQFKTVYENMRMQAENSEGSKAAVARSLANACLSYLLDNVNDAVLELAKAQYDNAQNMTDELAAFALLVDSKSHLQAEVITDFYKRWKNEDLVIDKWLSMQAMFGGESALQRVSELWEHTAVVHTNPNKVRALVGAFTMNIEAFHNADGSGYQWLADRVIEMDNINPQTTARLVSVFNRWKKYDENRQTLIKAQLKRILDKKDLSKDVSEIVSKAYNI